MIETAKLTKLYYTIGEVADMFQVNPSLIRFWEKEFSVIKPKKNAKGNRLFSPKDIENFNKIYHLVKVNGYTLDGARKALKEKSLNITSLENQNDQAQTEALSNDETIVRLESIKERLLKLKDQ
jgi:DNA-binding transcriptional MerR regulator